MILHYNNIFPKIDKSVFIADGAKIIGDVDIEEDSSVWFNAVIRGDVNFIKIGQRTNIQDGSILHVTNNKFSLVIGSDVTIGHNAVVHGCSVQNNVLIGMGSVILDNAVVSSNSIIAAGSLVKEGFIVPHGVLVAGVPAKVKREITEDEIKNISDSAIAYVKYAAEYKK
ncbi:MAG: gamma carbonic anhydrase family protein [Ignavibacteria bacterium]